jgi:endonuclease YncB( thermonuclease family)
MFPRSRSLLCLALFLVLAPRADADSFSGKVVSVTDGDTISVMRDGEAVKVRLSGIDCPEKKQAYGERAKQFTSDLAFGKTVSVSYSSKDRYGRIRGEVLLPGGKVLNQELVRAGYAWHYTQYSKDRTLAALEEEARKARRGLWQERDPVPPWEFRKARR